MKKILYVTAHNPENRKSWSGVLWSLNQELKKYFEVDNLIVPVTSPLSYKIRGKITKIITGSSASYSHSISRAKTTSKIVNDYLSGKHYDAIFVIDAACLTYVKTDIPIVYYSDGIVSKMVGYYWTNLSKQSIKEANFIQKRAVDNSTFCIFTNKWAKQGAIDDYGVPEEKIKIVHTGANVEQVIKGTPHQNIHLLFCGIDWDRKGGDIAVGCVRALEKMDPFHKYVLHMYGCHPPYEIKEDNIILHGFLNRDIPEQREIFENIWANADFFISPLKADCAAASFCEACAYGVPSVTYDTGGVGDHVINDYNGFRLPEGSSPEQFAKKIVEWIETPDKLNELKSNAKRLYEEDLNWQVAGRKIRDILELSMTTTPN